MRGWGKVPSKEAPAECCVAVVSSPQRPGTKGWPSPVTASGGQDPAVVCLAPGDRDSCCPDAVPGGGGGSWESRDGAWRAEVSQM